MKKVLIFVSLAVVFILLAVSVYYMIAMSRLPADDGDLGNIEEILVLPERPGTQSLGASGRPRESLRHFERRPGTFNR